MGTLSSLRAALLLVALLIGLASGQEQEPERDPLVEMVLAEPLMARSPELADRFAEATRLLDEGRLHEAEVAFEAVRAEAPDHAPTLWRLSGVLLRRGRPRDALALADAAVEASRSWQARVAVVEALLELRSRSSEESARMRALARDLQHDPSAPQAQVAGLGAQAALRLEDAVLLGDSVRRLERFAPDTLATYYFRAIYSIESDDLAGAARDLEAAVEKGLDPAIAARIREQSGIARRESLFGWAKVGAIALAAWLCGLLLLYIAGSVMSGRVLAAIDAFDGRSTDVLNARTQSLRRLYALIIGGATIYYYASIPIVIAIVLLLAGGIVMGFVALGRIPVKLVLIVGFLALASSWAMLKSLFVRRGADRDPGRPLPEAEAPELWALLRRIAERLGTRPVDAVYLTPGTDLAVTERGSMAERLRDRGTRSLIVGVGVLQGMSQRQFAAVMAHEYGHFAHRDTAGGDAALVVQSAMLVSMLGIASAGGATWYNPAWHFVSGFRALFLRVTLGASRLQEIMADHFAALYVGPKAFREGFLHVIRRGLEFDRDAALWFHDAEAHERPIPNLYEAPAVPDALADEMPDIDAAVARRLEAPGSPYDSHPPAGKRIAWVERVEVPASVDALDIPDAPVWDLLGSREALEKEFTAAANAGLKARGVID